MMILVNNHAIFENTIIISDEVTHSCQNGGTWNGKSCDCKENFSGQFCEFVADTIKVDTVKANVEVSVKIKSQSYTKELNNTKSPEFKQFESVFKQQMDIIYKDIEGYAGVKITSIRNGSIIVDHDVIINMTNPAELTPEYLSETIKDIEVKLKETTCNNATQDNSTGFVFDPGHVKVEEPVVIGDCASQVPENLEQYYKLTVTNKGAICASVCNEARKDSLKCGNGKCGMTNKGAKC
ncbi:mucin-3B-like [Chiloscyllium plagiosum]|uniref:mucin-3B-like n=1 Tax=Chiloscyllium plagiosum TaxID=36176 RepID=UPI001CB86549|nr:mucin-3B-like [Chiloscyllium plagiosum]